MNATWLSTFIVSLVSSSPPPSLPLYVFLSSVVRIFLQSADLAIWRETVNYQRRRENSKQRYFISPGSSLSRLNCTFYFLDQSFIGRSSRRADFHHDESIYSRTYHQSPPFTSWIYSSVRRLDEWRQSGKERTTMGGGGGNDSLLAAIVRRLLARTFVSWLLIYSTACARARGRLPFPKLRKIKRNKKSRRRSREISPLVVPTRSWSSVVTKIRSL